MTALTWQEFIQRDGRYARLYDLAAITGQTEQSIKRFRDKTPCQSGGPRRSFADLFARWHGRPPDDADWPAPAKNKGGANYEWQAPELALVARLVGQIDAEAIAKVLTKRLRRLTGDRTATRTKNSVQIVSNRIGLISTDMVGGLTVEQAGRTIGSRAVLDHEIAAGHIRARRVGRHVVIAHEEFARWKSTRTFPPTGFVKLATLKAPLGIRSDKLSEWARQGLIPTAIRCNPVGRYGHNTQFGTWWIDPNVSAKLRADRRAGRPMPWHGHADRGNNQVTYRLWLKRRHPAECEWCRALWGQDGPPNDFEEYVVRYATLAFGAKRHLTRPWSAGLRLDAVAKLACCTVAQVYRAIRTGALRASKYRKVWHVSRTDATRWKARRCPSGERDASWMTLATAQEVYTFSRAELARHIAAGTLQTKTYTVGPSRGKTAVLRQQVRELRDQLGYTEAEAARRVGCGLSRLRVLLRGLGWRPAPRIPFDVIRSAQKRQESAHGYTIAEAARKFGKSVAWVKAEIYAGTIRILRTSWTAARLYVSEPMFARLARSAKHPVVRERWTAEWITISHAANLTGTSQATILKWERDGLLRGRPSAAGRRFHRRALMAQSRKYWPTARYKRDRRPAWLQQETAA
jgi:predicted DNA-binding transcriptional regulator AlpA